MPVPLPTGAAGAGSGAVSAPRGSRKLWRVDEGFRGSASEGLAWCEELMSGYDLDKLSRLTVRYGAKKQGPPGVWGTCYHPTRKIPSYRITCSIKGPFPAFTYTRKSPLYAFEDGTYPPTPHGLRRGVEVVSRRNGKVRRWVRLYGQTELATLDEAIVWIVAHESYHFLRKTRQIPGRNVEIDADRFSDDALEHFRSGWSPSRFRTLQEQASLAQKERAQKAKGAPQKENRS